MPTLDYGNMLEGVLGEGAGLDPSRLDTDLAERFRAAHADVSARRESGEMGFFQLPARGDLLGATREAADTFGQWFENVVVIGIGGSSLGTATLRESLLGAGWNERDGEAREHYPRLYVLENPDPHSFEGLLGRLDLPRTLFNVVSKSGSTAETMAQFMVVWGRVEEALGPDKVHGHFLFTTSPDSGALRKMAIERGIPTLPVPENVGGRFSVLSPVGLLPAAVTGIDIESLLEGAGEMVDRCATPDLSKNPAGMLATLLHVADTEMGASIHVLMPYADRLRSFALWFQQLWAESLGKASSRTGERVEVGPTPLPAVGATDQHSQVQLFMEGPRDKVLIFLGVEEGAEAVTIPDVFPEVGALSYLSGHSLGGLLEAERRATTEALRRQGRPSMTIAVDRIDARAVGALFMLFQIATAYAGSLYGINPLDQPGVELGKVLTYGLMGRDGYATPEFPPPDPRWRV
ncbi:MAG: glucose-6-phosphate isomerase [Gemmatimonadetes bacterium]|nr:glucose-6-phosphate isomerase [Gemmatimonadota bacterium]